MRQMLLASAALAGIVLTTPVLADGMTPDDYLAQALRYVQQHQSQPALDAIKQAEEVLLEPPVPADFRGTRDLPGESDVVRQIGRARQAVEAKNWQDATYYIKAAMTDPVAAMPGTPLVGGPAAGHGNM